MRVVIVGGGPAGFSAAMVAKRAGAEVSVIERTDMLGGLGLVGGLGLPGLWSTALNQERALGGADLFDILDSIATHRGVALPGSEGVLLYNVSKLDSRIQRTLVENEIEFMLGKRAIDIEMSGNSVEAVILADGSRINGDVFIDATGTVAGMDACEKWAFGCVECIYRCPTFGNPGGIVEKKAKTFDVIGSDGKPGVIGGSVIIAKASLSTEVQQELSEKGFIAIPVPPGVEPDTARYLRSGFSKATYPDQEVMKQNIILLDLGSLVVTAGAGSPLYARSLRSFSGLEDATIIQPTAGARGQLVHGIAMALRNNSLKVDGFDNLFCAGPKAGEAICFLDVVVTGDLAGYNAVRNGLGQSCLELPKTLVAGAYVDHVGHAVRAGKSVEKGYQAVMQVELLKGLNVYREGDEIVKEVEKAGLMGIYKTKLC